MKLDKRIKNESLIYTPFTNTKVNLHEKGYFANDILNFASLKSCVYGELAKCDNLHRPYGCNKTNGEDIECYSFYIPENKLVKDDEKKYRPYTLEEFQKIFTIGQPIKFRFTGINTEKTLLLIGYEIYYVDNNPEPYILIGYETFKLDELLEEYEWQESDSNVWKPFGVAV